MKVIEFAESRLKEELRQNLLGADNERDLSYWSAYLDGAKAQLNEDMRNNDKKEAAR